MTNSCNVAEEFAGGSMKKAAVGTKEYIAKKGASEVPLEADLSKKKMNIGVSVDGSWGLKTSCCKTCKNLKHNREIGTIILVQYIESYNEQEQIAF